MRKIFQLLFFVEILTSYNTYAQNLNYWQQEVNNKINVRLDDAQNRLYGNIEIEYINNSPDVLQFIYFHLWANAYKDLSTAFAKQELRNGSTEFYFADIKERGFIDSLSFTINGKPAKLEPDSINPDIAKLILNEPLKPGERITIYTPFREQLPHNFSRGGHVGNSYQVSQWFPKPAVYDKKGWHPMPYLDQGEFYAEFGKYDVSITLPENYIVAATGNLQTETELSWLKELASGLNERKAEKTILVDGIEYPASSPNYKTIRYTQDNVHDFAWFTDKRFHVQRSEVRVPGREKPITTWAFYLDRYRYVLQGGDGKGVRLKNTLQNNTPWNLATQYIDSAVYYYSKWLGPYLYDNVTAVEGPLEAGDGMEYPTITIIGEIRSNMMLETVIAHEVGHNWLQGALAFNERDYPWMDEGINSYYERRYMDQRYPHYNALNDLGNFAKDFLCIDSIGNNYENYETLLFQERRHEDQPICIKSVDFSKFNYGAIVYAKMPYCMRYLEKYLGTEEFDRVMQSFYKEWQLKHPQPEDLQAHFNKQTGKELDWFFDDLLCTTKRLDYKIISAKDTVHIGGKAFVKIKVRNTGEIKGPLNIVAYKNEAIAATQWYGGFFGENELLMPYNNYDYYRIDGLEVMPEYNRNNNTLRADGILKKIEPFRLQPLGSIENPNRTELFFSPAIGYNEYDGAMVGLALYNSFIPVKNTEYLLIPMFSANTNRFRGIGRLNTFFYPKSNSIQYIQWMTTISTFAYNRENLDAINYYDDVRRISTQLDFKLKNDNFNLNNNISVRYVGLNQQSLDYFSTPAIVKWYNSNIFQLKYELSNNRKLNPFSLEVLAESGIDKLNSPIDDLADLKATFKYKFSYTRRKGLDLRIFSELGNGTVFSTGSTDYTFDHYFIGRNEETGLAAHQIYEGFGFMKFNPTQVQPIIGISDNYIVSLNLKSDLPIPLFFLFADLSFYDIYDSAPYSNNTLYDAGVGLKIIPGIFELYLPLLESTDIKQNIYSTPEYMKLLSRVMFTFQMEKLDIFKMIRNVEL